MGETNTHRSNRSSDVTSRSIVSQACFFGLRTRRNGCSSYTGILASVSSEPRLRTHSWNGRFFRAIGESKPPPNPSGTCSSRLDDTYARSEDGDIYLR